MSRPRRRKPAAGGGNGSGGGGNPPAAKRVAKRDFWGTKLVAADRVETVPVTSDPTAIVRSLGPPPFAGRENNAELSFKLVYERAQKHAYALAVSAALDEPS